MSAPAYGMTVEEYRQVSVEGDRTQLIDGVMVVNNPKPIHQFVQVRLIGALSTWTDALPGRGLALTPIDVELTERDLYGPDVVWIAEDRLPATLMEPFTDVPDLIAEIRSPSTWRFDIGRKRLVYEAGGLPELWLVDPYEEIVTVCRTDPDAPTFDVELRLELGDTLRSPQLPGFELALERIFRR
jgi:Uma2 family endonuclease